VLQIIKKRMTHTLIVALMSLNLMFPPATFANRQDAIQMAGQLTVNGNVTVNGKKAITGSTIFNDSRLSVMCASGNSAIVNLGRLGRIQLSPGTDMVIRFSDGLISGELVNGKAIVNYAAGVKVSINTPEGVAAADGKEASALAVNTQKGTRCVPMTGKSGGSSGGSGGSSGGGAALGAGGIAAIIVGAGGAATAVGIAASGKKNSDFNASFTLP
jgi:uncharacterized membrane protein YgcG